MAKLNKFDKVYRGKSLSDLEATRPYIVANVNRFQAAGNEAGVLTYRQVLAAVDRAIAKAQGQ